MQSNDAANISGDNPRVEAVDVAPVWVNSKEMHSRIIERTTATGSDHTDSHYIQKWRVGSQNRWDDSICLYPEKMHTLCSMGYMIRLAS